MKKLLLFLVVIVSTFSFSHTPLLNISEVENEKGFRVLKIDRTELLSKTARFGAVGVCDRCDHTPHTGYYVAVLNYWLCPDCFRNWYQDAEHYEEDLAYEEKMYRSYRKLFTSAEQEEQE